VFDHRLFFHLRINFNVFFDHPRSEQPLGFEYRVVLSKKTSKNLFIISVICLGINIIELLIVFSFLTFEAVLITAPLWRQRGHQNAQSLISPLLSLRLPIPITDGY
jgi:hypothetical protein